MTNHSIMGSVFKYHIRCKARPLPEALEDLGHLTTGSYGDVHCKNFCYDPIPEVWRDFETQSQKIWMSFLSSVFTGKI